MLEDNWEISIMLSAAGEDMEFASSTIKGIPGTNTFTLNNYDSVYEVDRQEYDFQISYVDFVNSEIAPKDTFNYVINSMSFTFEVVSFVNDLVGWVRLNCRLVGTGSV